jgi:hypothetical protein
MRIKLLLLTGLVCVATGAQAQTTRAIHGVKGYYNYTASQLQQDGFLAVDTKTGNKDPNWVPSMVYNGDFVDFNLGVGDVSKNWWRLSAKFNYKCTDATIKITKNYPVVGFKFTLPVNVTDSTDASFSIEHWWQNPYSGTNGLMTYKNGCGLNGVNGGGRMDYAHIWRNRKFQNEGTMTGRDSIKFITDNKQNKWYKDETNNLVEYFRTASTGTSASKDTSFVIVRLPDDVADGKSEFVAFLNYYSIADTSSQAVESKRLLDRMDIANVGFQLMFFGYEKIDGATAAPMGSIKWMKTFSSLKEALGSLTADNNYGDGTESALKTQLNYSLYYAEQALNGFKFRNSDPEGEPDDEAYITYKAAYEEANQVYNDANSTDADYSAANEKLQAARVAFNEAVDLPDSLVYNYVKSATSNGGIVIAGDESTIGGTTGKALTIGANDAASPLSFVATGSVVNGQKTYTLKSGSAAVVQASDGTLLLVEGATGSTFTFSERDTEGHGFDIHCGDYYYYLDQNGVLSFTKEIPEEATTDFDALSPYLFTIEDALGDYANTASEEEKTGLKGGWEFNDTPEDDPGTKGVVDGVEKTMAEYAETKMIEGWRMSRWRPYSRVNQETVKNSDNTSATCLVLTSAATYDNWDGSQSGITNDFSGPAAIRMDHGKENPFYVRDPNPRDSLYAYNFNAGINRYFAIKMKGTSDVKFGTLTFLGANSVTISADQITGQKGDVYYWDMLNSGFSVGKNLYTSAFFSPEGFTSADSKLYIDWMRTYSSIDEIPEESFADGVANGITTVKAADATGKFVVNGRTVEFFDGGQVYSIDGSLVANVKGHGTVALVPGVYLVKGGEAVSKVVVR